MRADSLKGRQQIKGQKEEMQEPRYLITKHSNTIERLAEQRKPPANASTGVHQALFGPVIAIRSPSATTPPSPLLIAGQSVSVAATPD